MSMGCKLSFILSVVCYCAATPQVSAKDFSDPDYGVSFEVDENLWKPAPIPIKTLGEPLVVLVDGPQPKMLLDLFVRMQTSAAKDQKSGLKSVQEKLTRIGNSTPGASISMNTLVKLAGRQAISFRMTGPGTGIGLGSGPVKTVQHWYAFLRGKELFVFQLTAPEDQFDAGFEKFEDVVKTVKFEKQRPSSPPQKFQDDELGLTLPNPGKPWIRGGYELGDFVAPGYLLRLWSAPSKHATTADGVSEYANRLALFLQFPGQKFEPQKLLELSESGLSGVLGATVIESEVRQIAGHDAMWLVVEGKSPSGSNLTGQGNISTRQLWVAVPRVYNGLHSIVVLLLNSPTEDYSAAVKQVEKQISGLKIKVD